MTNSDKQQKFTIRLFGSFEVWMGSDSLGPLRSRKGKWLLALLALRGGREVERTWLVDRLWPETLQTDALTSLRQSLADLRKAMGVEKDRLVSSAGTLLGLDLGDAFVDVLEFEKALKRADPGSLEQVVDLYRGPLLEGCEEIWVWQEREKFEREFLKAIESLALTHIASGDYPHALELLQRGIATDPFRQSLVCILMQTMARQEDYAGAIEVYHKLRDRLHAEFRTAPQPETQQVYQVLRAEARNTREGGKEGKRESGHPTPNTQYPIPEYPNTRTPEHPSLPSFPLSLLPSSLPHPLTSLVGREEEVQAILANLLGHRLVTLTGVGGVGKTRLAIQVAALSEGVYADGVCFAELSSIASPDLVAAAVAEALNVREERGQSWVQTLTSYFRARHTLLVLDNCEHLEAACASLCGSLLGACPLLRILTTSRLALRVPGESVWPVAPLAVPLSDPPLPPERLGEFTAVQLFLDRAADVKPTFSFSAQNAGAIARICRMLDGIPLAIELAAAWVDTLSLADLALLVSEGGKLSARDRRPVRHSTLAAMLEGSYRLLSEPEKSLFRATSIFAGGWTLDAMQALLRAEQASALPATATLGLLANLVSKSLIVSQVETSPTRYRLLNVVRQFARERLDAAGETATIRQRHASYFLGLAKQAEPHLTGPDQTLWLERLESEHDNFRAALDISVTSGDAIALPPTPNNQQPATNNEKALALRLAAALGGFWQVRGYFTEGAHRLRQALTASTDLDPHPERADALQWASILSIYQGDIEGGRRLAEEGWAIIERLGDRKGLADSYRNLGVAALNLGEYVPARDAFEQSLLLAQEMQDESGIAYALGYLGIVASSLEEFDAAEAYYLRSLEIRRTLNDTRGIAASLNNLGVLARSRNTLKEALTWFEESLALRRSLGDRRNLAITLNLLGLTYAELGQISTAQTHISESLRLCREIGDKRNIAYALEAFSIIAQYSAQWERAALLAASAEHLRAQIHSPLPPPELRRFREYQQRIAQELGEPIYQRVSKQGRSLTLDAVILHALEAP